MKAASLPATASPSGLNGGHALVEVVIAMLLLLIASSAITGTVLTGRQSSGRTVRRAQAAQAVRRVTEALKIYQTADPTAATGPGNAPNGWGLPGDDCGCAAFSIGRHNLDSAVWAPDLAAQGGAISYRVRMRNTALGPQPSVTFNVTWAEP